MRRVRIGIIGAGAITEWAVLPALSGPDAVAPPDTGAWWARRPTSHSAIRYQAAAVPEVVALADADPDRAERVGTAARVRAVYRDWRLMLREVQLDALLCVDSPSTAAEVAAAASSAARYLWIYGPPAASSSGVLRLAQRLEGRAVRLWCARPLRQAAAHRVARQLLERGEIGEVSALTMRWAAPLHVAGSDGAAGGEDQSHLASSYAALDLLLGLAANQGMGSAVPVQVLASEAQGSTSVYLRLATGTSATVLFSAAESWNSQLPRIEVCGTQGRTLICEAGRRLWLHKPHEPAREWEPPGLAAHISAPNLTGVAEDLKTFLAACVEPDDTVANERTEWGQGMVDAARALQLLEAAGAAVTAGQALPIEALRLPARNGDAPRSARPGGADGRDAKTDQEVASTLPLQL